MRERKRIQRQAVRDRLERALRDLYHNATVTYPALQNEYEERLFQSWFEDVVADDLRYIGEGGAYGAPHYYFTPRQRQSRYVKAALKYCARRQAMEQARCNRLDSRQHLTNALWERISDYGEVYQWGRGGRTVAPKGLINQGGGGQFTVRKVRDINIEEAYGGQVQLLMVVESFNWYVRLWCEGVPQAWQDAKDANGWQHDVNAHEGLRPRLVTVWA